MTGVTVPGSAGAFCFRKYLSASPHVLPRRLHATAGALRRK